MKQQQIDAFCILLGATEAGYGMPATAGMMVPDLLSARERICCWHTVLCGGQICPHLSTSTALWLGRQAGTATVSQSRVLRGVLHHSGKEWVKIGLEACACPLGCSEVWWLGNEGEHCQWLATVALHGSWGYFSFWSSWNTKYRDFSLWP